MDADREWLQEQVDDLKARRDEIGYCEHTMGKVRWVDHKRVHHCLGCGIRIERAIISGKWEEA